MIKITVELWPFGDETRKKEIASARIWNDGTGNIGHGSYGYELTTESGRTLRKGFLGEFMRSTFTVWWLIAAVMRKAFPNVETAFRDGRIVHKEKP
jgi:hypothetical protein